MINFGGEEGAGRAKTLPASLVVYLLPWWFVIGVARKLLLYLGAKTKGGVKKRFGKGGRGA